MTTRLPRDVVAHHLARLRPTLTKLQAARLELVLEVLGDDGRFLLRDALDAVELSNDSRGQDAFRDFREKVNAASAKAGVDLALELDSRRSPSWRGTRAPDRSAPASDSSPSPSRDPIHDQASYFTPPAPTAPRARW